MGLFDFSKKKKKPEHPAQEWVDLLFSDGTPADEISMSLILELTEEHIKNSNRIIADCQRIMHDTKNIDTFFTRYALFDEHVANLVAFEPYCKFSGKRPSELQAEAESCRYETVEKFLRIRYGELWDYVNSDAKPKSKSNRIEKFVTAIGMYRDQIPDDIAEHYLRKCRSLNVPDMSSSGK